MLPTLVWEWLKQYKSVTPVDKACSTLCSREVIFQFMWGNIFVCCRDQNSAFKPHGRGDLERLYNSVLVASWSWSTNRWRIVYSGLLCGKLGSKPQTFVHSLTLSPGPSSVWKKKKKVQEIQCDKRIATLMIFATYSDTSWAFSIKKKTEESSSSWNLDWNFSAPFLLLSSSQNYREKPRNTKVKSPLFKNTLFYNCLYFLSLAHNIARNNLRFNNH